MPPPTPTEQGPRRVRRGLATLGLLVTGLVCAGCASSARSASDPTRPPSGSIVVSAAASLQVAFSEIRTAFTASHPDVDVTLNFGASSTLAQQIVNGAPADVLASADEPTMSVVADAHLLAGPTVVLATNRLEIIVRRGNPSGITALSDLTRSGLVYITCAPAVPIGRYAAESLQRAGVTVKPASFEPDVGGIVAKVTAGEADAGIVYSTDIIATKGAADGVAIPDGSNVVARYPIAMINSTSNADAARAWIDFIAGDEGQRILRGYGFGPP